MKKVLMIVPNFPPIGGTGVLRSVKFVKYLPLFGWEAIVLTVDEKEESNEVIDASLLEDLPRGLKIYRSKYYGFNDIVSFFKKRQRGSKKKERGIETDHILDGFKDILRPLILPDVRIGWLPFAVSQGERVLMRNNADAIYSSSPYPTANLVAMRLANKYRKPWIADFRDPWIDESYIKRPFPLKQLERSIQKRVLGRAERIVIAWPSIKDYIQLPNFEKDSKTILIHNGFDEEDFQDVHPKTFRKFTIIHSGTFYKERSPEPLFRAIDFLLKEEPTLKDDIQIIFLGKEARFIRDLIQRSNFKNIISTLPHLQHKESLRYLLGADILYLNTVRNYVPGKTFEYMRSKRPILALVPEDTTVAKIIRSTESGVVIPPSKTKEVRDTILDMYKRKQKGGLRIDRKDDSVIYEYERRELTSRLADVLNGVV